MKSGQNSDNLSQNRWIQTSLAIAIILSETAVIILKHDLVWWKQILTILALIVLNTAYISFGIWQNKTFLALKESRIKEAQEREQILTIINSLPDSILSVNPRGEIQLFNSAAMNLLNTNENLTKKNLHKLLLLKRTNGEKFNFREIFRSSGSFYADNDLILEIDGEQIRIELEIITIRGFYSDQEKCNAKNFAVILRDITKQKTLDEERDEFISVVSHELRTPVAITEGAVSNLQLMISKNSPQNLLENSAKIAHDQVNFLATMVNDLSTLSRAERGVGAESETFCPQKFGEELFLRYQKQTEEKGLTLNLDVKPGIQDIRTSRVYLNELLQNLITNSIKYTKTGSITIRIEPIENQKVRFSIIDTGIGISKNEQAKIFDKFYRSEDYRTRETGGTGLGLYISKKLSRKLNTQIEVHSRLNRGSTFSFDIPFAKK